MEQEITFLQETHLLNKNNITSIAESIRSDIGYSIGDQFSWQSVDAAFKKWRVALETKSIIDTFNKEYIQYEVLCNKFANEFLVPAEIFKTLEPRKSEEWIAYLATQFSVSREVILRNYLKYGIIDERYYAKISNKWIAEAKSAAVVTQEQFKPNAVKIPNICGT